MSRCQLVLQFLAWLIRFINVVQVLHLHAEKKKAKKCIHFCSSHQSRKPYKHNFNVAIPVRLLGKEKITVVLTWLVEIEVRFTLV